MKKDPPHKRAIFDLVGRGVATVCIAVLVAVACSPPPPRETQSVAVETAAAQRTDVELRTRTVGTVDPVQTVSVRAQIGGYLHEIGFAEGEEIQAGKTLFRIDTRGLSADLAQAQAALDQARVAADNAEANLKRAVELQKQKFISAEEFDRIRAVADSAREAVKVQEAQRQRKDVERQYAVIRSPITGRAGALMVHKGDLVRANDTLLVTINQIHPIDVKFSVPEKDLGAVRDAQAAGQVVVMATRTGSESTSVHGELVFIDNTVDAKTGSITLKARFENSDETLWPGQFVDVEMVYGKLQNVVVVPAKAVEVGQEGPYVFVVGAERKAQLRKIRTGHSDDDRIVVIEGVESGEMVVTDGQSRLGPGMSVDVKNAPPAAGDTAP